MTRSEIVFFGNGPLADYTLPVLTPHFDIIFHAKTREDLETVKALKKEHPAAHAILASFGVIIKKDVLDLFEPEGIINIHPSLLPKYRGPSPIETAIMNRDQRFGVSIMKLVPAMDAGPIYYQTTHDFAPMTPKDEIYHVLATAGAEWLVDNLGSLPRPVPQDDNKATFTKMLDKSLSPLDPEHKTAAELLNQIRAFSGFPKSKFTFFGLDCTVISAHVATPNELSSSAAPESQSKIGAIHSGKTLFLRCYDKSVLIIDSLQPAGRKVMDVTSFLNGYAK